MTHPSQSGNALWFILLAIVLLGGLTVLMSRSSGTSEDSGDFERQQINASEISRFAKGVELAVRNLQANNCSENLLNFDKPDVAGDVTAGAPGDGSCDIFSDKGGGISYRKIPQGALDVSKSGQALYGHWLLNSRLNVPLVGEDTGAAGKELLIIAPFLTRETCFRINALLGVDNAGAVPPKEDDTPAASFIVQFTGTFGGGTNIDGAGNAAGAFDYKTSGCTTASNEDSYYFYQVLVVR